MEESCKSAVVRSVTSNNAGSEYNKDMLIDMEERDAGSVKTYSPLGMCVVNKNKVT